MYKFAYLQNNFNNFITTIALDVEGIVENDAYEQKMGNLSKLIPNIGGLLELFDELIDPHKLIRPRINLVATGGAEYERKTHSDIGITVCFFVVPLALFSVAVLFALFYLFRGNTLDLHLVFSIFCALLIEAFVVYFGTHFVFAKWIKFWNWLGTKWS